MADKCNRGQEIRGFTGSYYWAAEVASSGSVCVVYKDLCHQKGLLLCCGVRCQRWPVALSLTEPLPVVTPSAGIWCLTKGDVTGQPFLTSARKFWWQVFSSHLLHDDQVFDGPHHNSVSLSSPFCFCMLLFSGFNHWLEAFLPNTFEASALESPMC